CPSRCASTCWRRTRCRRAKRSSSRRSTAPPPDGRVVVSGQARERNARPGKRPRPEDHLMGETYGAAGVDIAAGEAAVERIKAKVRSTYRPEVLGDIGGFGGLVTLPEGYRQPVLVSSTDGVGTKAMVARAAGRFD